MNDLKEILTDILEILSYINNNHDTRVTNYINEIYDKVKKLEVLEDEKED